MIINNIIDKKIESTKRIYKEKNVFLDVENLKKAAESMYIIYTADFTTSSKIFYLENCIEEFRDFIELKELLHYNRFVAELVKLKDSEFVAKKVSYNTKIKYNFFS